MINEELRNLQLIELGILKVIAPIFEEQHIAYYLSSGTLLGAVRHQGFIPWDDDMDIMIPREDYNRFLKCFADALPPYMELATVGNGKTTGHLQAKITDTRYFLERDVFGRVEKYPVWVDVFPLDCFPSTACGRLLFKLKVGFQNTKVRLARSAYRKPDTSDLSFPKKFVWLFSEKTGILYHLDLKREWNKLESILSSYTQEKGQNTYRINFYGEYRYREAFPSEWLGERRRLIFEGDEYAVPQNTEGYLQSIYGDYMKLPPIEQRRCKHFFRIHYLKEDPQSAAE